ncbi:hypothetical protein [Flavobacterium sp. GT3P67]|nr:hypothetical protein [Flavobacterium sp. GT3P67]
MKTLSKHIQESFNESKEEQQTVVENLNDNQEEVVNEDTSAEKEEQSE